jgi:hypothetical protein
LIGAGERIWASFFEGKSKKVGVLLPPEFKVADFHSKIILHDKAIFNTKLRVSLDTIEIILPAFYCF